MNLLDQRLRELAIKALSTQHVSQRESNPSLHKLRELGTELWLDTGDIQEAKPLWRAEFSALTTNNTLVYQVSKKGLFDDEIRQIAKDLPPNLSADEKTTELAFAMNCRVALGLVSEFDSMVSVELHPGLAHNLDRSVAFAERYFSICPERFYIKIPLTPEGYAAVARIRSKGIPVNFTLGFSARQNVLASLISNPTFCNVFLGRLNSVISDNELGDGIYVGEKATLATEQIIRSLRISGRTGSRLIAASMRSVSQVNDLAGVDVYTMPPKVVQAYLESNQNPGSIVSKITQEYPVKLANGFEARASTLWNVEPKLMELAQALLNRGTTSMSGVDIKQADADHGTGLFHRFSKEETAKIRENGKIPDPRMWPRIALDDLMTQAALQSFVSDQAALDDYLRGLAG